MPLDAHAFTLAVSRARDRVRDGRVADVAAEQQRLRALVPDDASDDDKRWTATLIDRLAASPPPPPQRSPLYHQAAQIHADAYEHAGSDEERITALEDARRRIFTLADLADEDEAADIRAMTRPLEHRENELREPSWPAREPPRRAD